MIQLMRAFLFVVALSIASGAPAADDRTDRPAAAAACTAIRTAADLDKIRANPFGSFCLTADIDLAAIANFKPIAAESGHPFLGTLDGRGHAIRNLKIRSTGRAGFFDRISGGFTPNSGVKNLRLINVSVVSTGGDETGGLAAIQGGAFEDGGSITNVSVSGAVSGTDTSLIGGLLGVQEGGTILRSHSSAAVTAGNFGGHIGGLVGFQSKQGTILQSYATGPVTASGFDMAIGGLVGDSEGTIRHSFASGPVKATSTVDSDVGGLVGYAHPFSTPQFPPKGIFTSFATGPVTSIVGSRDASVGGLAGVARPGTIGAIDQTYAVGRISVDKPAQAEFGGLLGDDCDCAYLDLRRSYWNPQTTRIARSDGGAARNTTQLQASLPAGFSTSVWGITPGVSFPYLKLAGMDFRSPLAITVFGSEVFTFLPISQLEKSEYSPPISRTDLASKAAAYTMIARAVGVTRRSPTLQDARINQFWDGSAAVWQGAVKGHAALGAQTGIASGARLGRRNVIGPLRADRVVLLRGSYTTAAAVKTHWVLATSFTVDSAGVVTGVVANDPWTGRQVTIDPATKRVVSPVPFPLSGFTVNGFQVVTLKSV